MLAQVFSLERGQTIQLLILVSINRRIYQPIIQQEVRQLAVLLNLMAMLMISYKYFIVNIVTVLDSYKLHLTLYTCTCSALLVAEYETCVQVI